MKYLIERYLNEIVGLSMMALMIIALVAGQTDAMAQSAAVDGAKDFIEIHISFRR
jgi:hypothetical protein